MYRFLRPLACVLAILPGAAVAQLAIPEANGIDGAYDWPTGGTLDQTLNLSNAITYADWENSTPPGYSPGQGIYDPARWAVIYRFSSVTIGNNSGTDRLFFTNHASRAPVVWLVSGDVVIHSNAQILLDGSDAAGCAPAEPGPGGFRGAAGRSGTLQPASDGFGPGGGLRIAGVGFTGGSFGGLGLAQGAVSPAATYASPFLVPLIGGSGGAPRVDVEGCFGAGAGGGAILIAATGTITVNGTIYARGGSASGGGGSGGAIRLLASTVAGSGALNAGGGSDGSGFWTGEGGAGRIAVNANAIPFTGTANPTFERFEPVALPITLWSPPTAPAVRPISVVANGQTHNFPADPRAQFSFPSADVAFDTTNPLTINIEARNVPVPPDPNAWSVVARITPRSGVSQTLTATYVSGDTALSMWSLAVDTPPRGFGAIQVRAFRP
ncbi:MAG: hypothetical protein AB7Q17_03755 [Phycisphaerae bacterium]